MVDTVQFDRERQARVRSKGGGVCVWLVWHFRRWWRDLYQQRPCCSAVEGKRHSEASQQSHRGACTLHPDEIINAVLTRLRWTSVDLLICPVPGFDPSPPLSSIPRSISSSPPKSLAGHSSSSSPTSSSQYLVYRRTGTDRKVDLRSRKVKGIYPLDRRCRGGWKGFRKMESWDERCPA
jgi:hypothetical protein